MKFRKGFVSNSSSSSFICDISGEIFTGMDMCLSDFDLYQCVNGHTFHKDFLVKDPQEVTLAEKKEIYKKYVNGKFNDDTIESLWEDFIADFSYETPSEFCPICSFKEMHKKDMLTYLMKKYDLTKEKLLLEISSFQSYDKFKEYLK